MKFASSFNDIYIENMSDVIAEVKISAPRSAAPAAKPPLMAQAESTGKAPASQPAEIPQPEAAPPKTKNVSVIIRFKDGTSAAMVENDFDKVKYESRAEFISSEYGKLAKFLSENKDKVENFQLLSPYLKVMYLLDLLQNRGFQDEKLIQEILNYIESLPSSDPNKAYLLLIAVKKLLAAGKLSPNAAKEMLNKIMQLWPDDLSFYETYAEIWLALKLPAIAVRFLGEFFKKHVSLESSEKGLEGLALAEVLIGKLKRGDWLNKYGDYLMIWADLTASTSFKKEILLAAEKCYLRAIEVDKSLACWVMSNSKLGDVNTKLAEFETEPGKYFIRNAILDRAILCYEEALKHEDKIKIDHMNDNVGLLLKLGDALVAQEQEAKAEEYLEKAARRAKDPKIALSIWQRREGILIKLGRHDKALAAIRELYSAYPKVPLFSALHGDILAYKGYFKEALAAYQLAFQKAKAAEDPAAAHSEIYRRFTLMRIQARMKLAKLDVRYGPNLLKMLVRLTGDALYFMNPFNFLSNFIKAVKNPNPVRIDRHELEAFVAASEKFEEQALTKLSETNFQLKFYLDNLLLSLELKKELEGELSQSGKAMVEVEIIDGIKNVIGELNWRIYRALELISKNDLVMQKAWETASKSGSARELLSLFKDSLQNYISLATFLAGAKIPEDFKGVLTKAAKKLWASIEDRFDAILKFAGNKKDGDLLKVVYQLMGQLDQLLSAVSKNDRSKRLRLEKKQEKTADFIQECLEKTIKVAVKNKDYKTLLDLAKGYERFGELALDSLKSAKKLAAREKDGEKLKEIAGLAYEIFKKVDLSSRRNIYRDLTISARLELLGIYKAKGDRKEYSETAVSLWRLGRYSEVGKTFEQLAESETDQASKARLLIDLAHMYVVIGDKKKARSFFLKALKLLPGNKELLKEIEYLSNDRIMPADVVPVGASQFPPRVLRANAILYSHWDREPNAETLKISLREFHEAHGIRGEVKVAENEKGPIMLTFNPSKVARIKIVRLNKTLPRRSTRDEAILRELRYAGLKVGDAYDEKKFEEAFAAAARRLQTYNLIDWRAVEENGEVLIELRLVEQANWHALVGGRGGRMEAKVLIDAGFDNLFGGGESVGAKVDYTWFFGEWQDRCRLSGGKRACPIKQGFELFQGVAYYRDPHLFSIKNKIPVAFELNIERFGRFELTNMGREMLSGGSATFGLVIKPNLQLKVSPGFYYVDPDFIPDHFKNGFRIGLDYDKRNSWLFPSSGYIVSGHVEPGMYYGGVPFQGYVRAGAEVRKYFSLPFDFSLMLALRGGVGTNLIGGDNYLMTDNYVRGSRDFSKFGPGIAAATGELRAPVINIGEYGKYAKIQPYIFADFGIIFKSSANRAIAWGVGAGTRFRLPLLGIINLYYAFPGGFGFMVGSPLSE